LFSSWHSTNSTWKCLTSVFVITAHLGLRTPPEQEVHLSNSSLSPQVPAHLFLPLPTLPLSGQS
jgi:hypothetical protein